MGRFGRRLVAALIDWTICQLIGFGVFGVPLPFTQVAGARGYLVLAIFVVENLLLVTTLGSTLGHRIVSLRVRSTDGHPARPFQVLVRTVLLSLFLPAMFWDRDGRGLHDKAAGTLIVRT
jgi:uncharacterized RDD family membrane protein YckC